MKRLLSSFLRPLLEIFMRLSYWISREKKETIDNSAPKLELDQILEYAVDLNKYWNYIMDPFFGIYNTIASPEIAWKTKQGDCDDFASHLIHLSRKYDPLLLTYFTWDVRKAHTVMLIINQDSYYIFNWSQVYIESSFKKCINRLEKYSDSEIISYHTAVYDYKKKKYIAKRVH